MSDSKMSLRCRCVKRGIYLILLFVLLFYGNIQANAEKKVIRIGAIVGNSFIEEADGIYRGYGVEYLKKIAEYTGWTYEYEFDTWENCLERLENGELDFVCNAQYNRERAERFLYSNIPLGYDYTILYTCPDRDIYYEDYEAMKGLRVGLLQDSVTSESFIDYAAAKGLDSEIVYFDTEDQMTEALQMGNIDMAAMGSLYRYEDVKAVGRFGTSPFYCITQNRNILLMQELDDALQYIKVDEPEIEASLAEKYYGDSQISSSPLFTREESAYIANAGPIRVKLMANARPLSYAADGRAQGIFVDFLDLLSEKSGLEFQIEMESTPGEMEAQTQQVLDEDYLMLRAKRTLEANGLEESLITTKSFIDTKLAYVRRMDAITDSGRKDYVFAITKEMGYLPPLLKSVSEQFEIKYYNSTEECLNAVLKGEADIAAQDAYVVTYLLQKPKYAEELAECPGMECENGMCLIASDKNQMLVQILDKTIRYISNKECENIVTLELLMNPYKLGIGDIIYRYWKVMLLIAGILVTGAAIYTILMRRMTKLEMQKKEYEFLQKKIQLDELTGAFNRPAFYKKAKDMIDNALDDMCIVLMDISNFKVVNDLYGIKSGDKLLRFIVQELKRLSEGREVIVGRFTGDHFYMCMKRKDFEEIQFPKRYKTFLEDMDITVTYGVFLVGDKKDVPINIMCDRANIAAHDMNRKRVEYIRYYSEDERNKLIREQEIVNDMEKALSGRQFSVYVQPKYDIVSEKIVGGEALVRWFHPQKGMISPGEFIPVFEKNGFIIRLDYYVWEETCRLIAELKEKGFKQYPISINVSRAHFYGKELQDKLEELIAKYGLDTDDIELEITETICAEDPDIIYKKIRDLQKAGFKVAMDDFGSGYSSLNMLKEMPLDIIKMDLKFLDGGNNEDKSRNILKTLISLAKSMKLYVVVEGVETKDQVDFLRGIGSYCAQGYYYSRPVDCAAYEEMLHKEKTAVTG